MDQGDLAGEACRELLRSAPVGRVAIATPAGPEIALVDFRILELDGEPTLVLSTPPHSVLGSADPSATLAFEVDEIADGEWRYVVVRGPARRVAGGRTLELVRAAWRDPTGRRRVFLVMEMAHVNGRRVGTGLT